MSGRSSRRPSHRVRCWVTSQRHSSTSVRNSDAPPPRVVSVVANDGRIAKVGYFTDVEGHDTYFNASVARSEVLEWGVDESGAPRLELLPGTMFVFGGDAFDKGTADLRVAALLSDLKRRHPDRVFLLMGNRDVNKMKLTSELHDSDVYGRSIDEIPGPYWVPRDSQYHVTLRQYLEREFGTAVVDSLHTRVNRLKYMYGCQMGCFNTFEFRRQDIAARRGCDVRDVSDGEVVDEVVAAVGPGGAMRDYIRCAQLAVVIGDTLFVHGGVTPESMGFLPLMVNHDRLATGPPPGVEMADDHSVQAWVQALNEYCTAGVEDWISQPEWNEDRSHRGGSMLMGYGYRPAMQFRTVMVQSYMDLDQHPTLPPDVVADYLNRSGIHRVVCGHQPFGDSPLVMRAPGKLEVITADTSFSDPESPSDTDTRGEACSSLHLHNPTWTPDAATGTAEASFAVVSGVLKDGAPIDFALPPPSQAAAAQVVDGVGVATAAVANVGQPREVVIDPVVGRQTVHGWWVKARVSSATDSEGVRVTAAGAGGSDCDAGASAATGTASDSRDSDDPVYVLSMGEGFTVHYRRARLSELRGELLDTA